MNTPLFSSHWEWQNRKFRFDIYKATTTFDHLENIKQVYGIILDKARKNILVVHNKSASWILPGGKVEPGETTLQTLIREVKEETNREILLESVRPAFFQISNEYIDKTWVTKHSEVRYFAIVDKDLPFVQDPDDGDITEARWVTFEEIPRYLDWGETAAFIEDLTRAFAANFTE